ncbi:hypothetical protein HYY69_04840 [Candidatus Woesearchaeota archaeon]|nr:hypothetical protein [Candidatus Woesearchaeota archaeon]
MFNLKILNKKKIKELQSVLEKQWGASLEGDYVFFVNAENRIYLINRQIGEVDLSKLRINSLGLYFGQMSGTELRLSIEGTQLVGKTATKNVFEMKKGVVALWVKGYDISLDQEGRTMFIMKYGDNYLGCGKLIDKKIINYIPKERRVKSEDTPE